MFSEDDLLPISALQHLLFCPRQCALIHLERLWAENSLTREGRHLHEKADSGKRDRRDGVRTERAVLLRSFSLGLFGKADVVEFRAGAPVGGGETRGRGDTAPWRGSSEAGNSQLTTGNSPLATSIPFPIEYKRGKPKKDGSDLVQLCAQALCFEEMLGVPVPAGAMFYGKTRRRVEVAFDSELRGLALRTITALHEMIASRKTPAPVYVKKKCERCSLRHLCLPQMPVSRATSYLDRSLAAIIAEGAAPA
jgi:CRISPR-associated exonuclease Cas4